LFAGVDTAAMHLSAACQTPTVGIFGPSVDWQWAPWKCPHRVCAPLRQIHVVRGRAARIGVSLDAQRRIRFAQRFTYNKWSGSTS